jgi:hydrogenase maturation protease
VSVEDGIGLSGPVAAAVPVAVEAVHRLLADLLTTERQEA